MAAPCGPVVHDDEAEKTTGLLQQSSRNQAARPGDVRATSDSVLVRVCLPILVLQFSLWVATATLTGSVPIYLRKHLGVDSVRATEINYAFQTLGNLAPIGGGYLADQHLGRFNTILLACALLTTGLVLCTIAAHPSVASVNLLLVGLFGGVALAQGGTGPCIVVLGADQFDMSIASHRVEKQSYFNWFYWSINVGSSVSFAFLANLAVSGLLPFITPRMGFFAAYAIATLVFATGSFVFFSGRRRYRKLQPTGSVLSEFLAELMSVCTQSLRGWLVLSGIAAFFPGIFLTTASYFVASPSSWHLVLALSGAGAVVYGVVVLIATCSSVEWVHRGSLEWRDPAVVQDVSCVLRILPYMSIIVIFWATYAQMETNFLLQGCQMDLRIPGGGLISSAMLTLVDTIVILLFIPVFDRVVYPTMQSLGLFPSMLRKIGTGLVFSLATMLCAAWIEIQRKQRDIIPGIGSNCADEDVTSERLPMAQISVFWQALQYLLIGLSEILTSITSYDLFYTEVPTSMRSACQSLNMLTTTLGYIVGGVVNSIFSFWITSDLNDGKLENIFFVMAALVGMGLATFVYISQSFEYKESFASSPDESTSEIEK